MTETRPAEYPKLENYTPSPFMLPTSHYDEDKADRAVMFIENLRHTKGKWAGKRFWLLPWQEQIIRDIFGIIKEDGTRQFHTAYIKARCDLTAKQISNVIYRLKKREIIMHSDKLIKDRKSVV